VNGERPIALLVSYAGSAFAGFQRQAGPRTVQQVLEEALGRLSGQAVAVRGAGRTDAGVHALGQVADCCLPATCRIAPDRLPLALSATLPPDMAIAGAEAVPPGFHARFWAQSKHYRYLFWRAAVPSPFWRPYAWHFSGPLDVAAMAAAAADLVGRHDCRAFAGSARPVDDATRTILECSVCSAPPWLAIDVRADGFLYRMVRTIAGTLFEVGRGARPVSAVRAAIAGRDRRLAGPALPAHGLCLLGVRYPDAAGPTPPSPGLWPP